MTRSFAFSRHGIAALLAAGGVAFLASSCGSRTGLFAPDTEEGRLLPDGGLPPDAALDGAVPCIPGRFAFDVALTQLMFVIDRSGSMRFTLDGRTEEPRPFWRWSILRDSLRIVLPTFDQQIAMGAKFFPEVLDSDLASSEESCRTDTGVGIPPGRGNAAQIVNVFDRTEPRGGTPTSEAVRIAAQFLTQNRSVARTIVLATDGAPNCNPDLNARTCVCTSQLDCAVRPSQGRFSCLDDDRTVRTIREVADNQKIPVYVIGIGSTERQEFLQTLDEMAVAGGRPRPTTPRHYNVQSAADLTNALTSIRDSVARCTYLTPSAPVDPNRIAVEINGQVILRDQTKTNGWDWIDQSFGWLAFFGEACTAAQGATASIVSGVVSCEAP